MCGLPDMRTNICSVNEAELEDASVSVTIHTPVALSDNEPGIALQLWEQS
jgi:hypothetical protein